MRPSHRRLHGFTLAEIMIVIAIIGILLAIALPGFLLARARSQMTICQENLTKIDHAKEVWAFENQKEQGDTPTANDLYGFDLYVRSEPECPSGGEYSINAVGLPPSCSLSASEDHFILNYAD